MYAVIQTGGKQYRVSQGETLNIELIKAADGEQVTFDQVLLVGNGDSISVGQPVVKGVNVTATVLGLTKGPKVFIFKHSGKTTLRRKSGHRQKFTRIRIESINL